MTVYGEGAQTLFFAHVREVARALVGLGQSTSVPGRVVNVGSAVESSVSELAATVIDVAGSRSEIQRVPFHDVFPRGFVDPPRRVPALDRLRAANGWVPPGLRELEDVRCPGSLRRGRARVGSAPRRPRWSARNAPRARQMPGVPNAGHRNGGSPHPRSPRLTSWGLATTAATSPRGPSDRRPAPGQTRRSSPGAPCLLQTTLRRGSPLARAAPCKAPVAGRSCAPLPA